MKMRIASVVVLLALSALVLSALPAQATTIGECRAHIDLLLAQTGASDFFGHNAAKDEAGLVAKLLEAREKLDLAKLVDAIQKMTDYQSKVTTLSLQGKLAADDATVLSAGADDVVACIAAIGQ